MLLRAKPTETHVGSVPLSEEPDRILYQVYVETFKDGALSDGAGDFAGLESKLPYLQELGVTGVLLMPIFNGGGMGYMVDDYRVLRKDYGASDNPALRREAFKRLAASARQKGIKILLDVPINHISHHSEWFKRSEARVPGYEDHFLWQDKPQPGWKIPWDHASTPESVWHWSPKRKQYYYGLFGTGMPDLNHEHPQVQSEILDLLKDLSTMGASGFRIDAAKHLVEGKDNLDPVLPENRQRLKAYLAELRRHSPEQSFMLEAWSNQYSQFEPYLPDAGDIVFDFAYMETLRDSIIHRHPWAVRNAVKHLEEVQDKYKPGNRIVFAGNHDVARIRTILNNDRERAEVAHAVTLILPFAPMLYYGDEIFMPGNYLRSPKPKLSDNGVCTPMAWTPERNAGFTDPSFQLGEEWNRKIHGDWKIYNVQTQCQDPASFFNWIRKLIQLRKSLRITNEAKLFVDNHDPSDPVLTLAIRLGSGECIAALFNFSNHPQTPLLASVEEFCGVSVFETLIEKRADLRSLGPNGVWIGKGLR